MKPSFLVQEGEPNQLARRKLLFAALLAFAVAILALVLLAAHLFAQEGERNQLRVQGPGILYGWIVAAKTRGKLTERICQDPVLDNRNSTLRCVSPGTMEDLPSGRASITGGPGRLEGWRVLTGPGSLICSDPVVQPADYLIVCENVAE